MNGNDYKELKEQMTRIEMKLDQLLRMFVVPEMESPKPVISSFRQRCDEAIARGLVSDQRRAERELKKARLKEENKE